MYTYNSNGVPITTNKQTGLRDNLVGNEVTIIMATFCEYKTLRLVCGNGTGSTNSKVL